MTDLLTAPDPPPVEAAGLTTFYVLTVSDDLRVYTHVNTVQARDREHALRLAFGKEPPLSVAVSEHAFRVKRPRLGLVVTGLDDVTLPDPTLSIFDGAESDGS